MKKDVCHLNKMIESAYFYPLIDELQIGIYAFAPDGKTVLANTNFQRMLGYTGAELQTKTLEELFAPDDVLFFKQRPAAKKRAMIRAVKKDGSSLPFHLLAIQTSDDSSILLALLAHENAGVWLSSFTNLEKLIYALDRTAAVSVTDAEGTILYANDRLCEVCQYSREELLGNNHRLFLSGQHPEEFYNELWQSISKGQVWSGEICSKAKDGSIWRGQATIVPLLNEKGVLHQYIGICQDITAMEHSEEKYCPYVYYDFLTKLPNRRLFEWQLEEAVRAAEAVGSTVSLMLINVHGLKFVNESLGMKTGDQLLQLAAMRLQQILLSAQGLARIDGNEYAIILPNISERDLIQLAKRIIQQFAQPFFIGEYELYVKVSIGMSMYPDDSNSVEDLMKNASLAMNYSKAAAPNDYQLYSDNIQNQSKKELILKSDLRKALKENEFFLYFQPRIDPKSDAIIGAEALIRWKHPKYGVISPLEFIPLAEEEGLIGQIGEWVLYTACWQNKKWQDAGLPKIIISVNYSVIQFLQSDMIREVERVLQETGLAPQYLEIEITETAFMKDQSVVSKKIEILQSMGIKTAIDDFGTGYASLSYLKNLKTNTLKIDSSFIEGIPLESVSSEIVSSIIRLAKRLNIRTVAEGVETLDQLRILKEIHVDEIQGYLYSKPVSTEEFEKLLRQGRFLPN